MFSFAALDYASSDKNHYRYRLEGFDDDWMDAGQVRSATYTSLPAGDYSFTVKAANNDGVWNDRGASFQLHVAPPPWQSIATSLVVGRSGGCPDLSVLPCIRSHP